MEKSRGMRGVAVKCLEIVQNPDAKAAYRLHINAEARKRGYRTGLDTLVVHAVNDECLLSGQRYDLGRRKAISIPPGKYVGKGETQ